MPDANEVTEIKDVPAKKVGTNVQQVIQTGAIKIVCTRQENGKWTIRVT
jgi:hypothetical protein